MPYIRALITISRILISNTFLSLPVSIFSHCIANPFQIIGQLIMAGLLRNHTISLNLSSSEFRKTPFDSEFKEGDFAHLECLATSPEVQLSWEKDGRSLPQLQSHITVLKNGYIFMERVRVEDAGLYTCVARDTESGCTRRVSATLKVIEETKIEESEF